MKKFIFIFCSLLLSFNLIFAQLTENVFVVVIDGARYSETFGHATHQYIPKIWNELRPMGAIYTSFYIDGQTSTNPGHASIESGTWQYIPNDGSVRPTKPTFFEYFRQQKGTSVTDNYVVLGKSKLNILSYSTHADYGSNYGASVKTSSSQYNDIVTLNNVKSVINSHHPKLVIINFAETDNAGHSGSWNTYLNAIQRVDTLIYNLWNTIQNDTIYSNKTTMFITNDHGRHTTDFTNHGDTCDGCRHIMLLAVGPDTPAGVVDSALRKQIDIAPTIGYLLDFNLPHSVGTFINTAITTSIADRGNLNFETVNNFELAQNYPNPFNASTTINYYVGSSALIQMHIYDAMGRVIRLLENNKPQAAGRHQLVWDGRDTNNQPVSSGTYFYSLSVQGEKSATKRMLMIK